MLINLMGKYQIIMNGYIRFNKVQLRHGICSNHSTMDTHMLLWDFDKTEKYLIMRELQRIQTKYKLPTILILKSSENHYHAYCFANRSFKEVINILSDTQYIDEMYLRLGVARGYYTLRYSEKQGKPPELCVVLKSFYPIEAKPTDFTTNVYYTTNI